MLATIALFALSFAAEQFTKPLDLNSRGDRAKVAASWHFGDPYAAPCLPDEIETSIQGLTGAVCAPKCVGDRGCPTDLPPNVTAIPQCNCDNNQYCLLTCRSVHFCGEKASCKGGTQYEYGTCTYDA